MLDQYVEIWRMRSPGPVANILELGIFDGGSIAFWHEILKPTKHVALDIRPWGDSDYFRHYVDSRGLHNRIKTYWNTDQADREALLRIVNFEFATPLDLVIDDASHMYEATRSSFETLFPLLRPGGLYLIEDWSWCCWPNLPQDFPLPRGTELPPLIFQLVEAVGSHERFIVGETPLEHIVPLIASLTVFADIVVVERGGAGIEKVANFSLETLITHRP
jgi:hypothetical protein